MSFFRKTFFKGFLLLAGIFFISESCRIYSPAIDYQRMIFFSGETWLVKNSSEPVGPGPNMFSSDPEQVWVDSSGALHLAVRYRNGQWKCAEITSARRFSYGTYTFKVIARLDQLDPAAVLGFFSWNPVSGKHNREVDIEISHQGDPGSLNAQYVVQPYHLPFHQYRFDIKQNGDYTTHQFTWRRKDIQFKSYHGHNQSGDSDSLIAGWTYEQTPVKYPGRIQVRINLWLFKGNPPANQKDFEIIVREFKYIPLFQLPAFGG